MNLENLSVKGKLSFFAKTAVFYGGASAFNKILSLATFPIITRHFSTAEYGLIDFFSVLSGLLLIISMFGVEAALGRLFYHYESDSDRRQLITQTFLYQSLVTVSFALILYLTVSWSILLFPKDSQNTDILKIVIFQLPFLMILAFSQNLLFYTHKKQQYVFLSVGSSVVTVMVLLVSFGNFNLSVYDYFSLIFAFNIVFSVVGLILVRHWFVSISNLKILPSLLKISVPIGISSIVGSSVPMLERWIITENLSIGDLGTYAVATRIAALPVLMLSALLTPWGAFSVAIYNQPDAVKIYNAIYKILILLILFSVFSIASLGYPLLLVLASEKYISSLVLIFPMTLTLLLPVLSSVTELGIILSKKTKYYIYINAFHLISTSVFLYVFMSHFGLLGVALGIMLSQFVKFILGAYLANLSYPIQWAYRQTLPFFVASIAAGLLLVFVMNYISNYLSMLIFASFSALSIIGGYFLFMSKVERDLVRSYFMRRYLTLKH